jgi:cytochrome c-type biogenesis protein CcsB
VSVNFGLAQQSNHFLIGTVLLYSLALLAFAGDFAFGRHPSKGETPAAEVPELVAAGVPAAGVPAVGVPAASVGAGPGSAAAGSEFADSEFAGSASVGPGSAGSGPAGSGPAGSGPAGSGPGATGYAPRLSATTGPGGRSRGSWLPTGSWVRAALVLSALGLAAHVIGVTTRGLAVHRVPWGDMYEFVTSVTCVAAIFFLALMIRYRAYYLGLFVMAPVLLALGLAETVIYTPAGQIAVALQSYWLAIHVTAMTLATGAFVVGAALAVVYLLAERYARRVAAGRQSASVGAFRLLPAPEVIDRFAYRTVMFAFPIWTFGIMAGAIWADTAWGRYWGWDPTETWAFITWVVYACFLHARATAGWRGRRAAYIQLIGFGCLLFNLLGVSIFITGLHSYAGLS